MDNQKSWLSCSAAMDSTDRTDGPGGSLDRKCSSPRIYFLLTCGLSLSLSLSLCAAVSLSLSLSAPPSLSLSLRRRLSLSLSLRRLPCFDADLFSSRDLFSSHLTYPFLSLPLPSRSFPLPFLPDTLIFLTAVLPGLAFFYISHVFSFLPDTLIFLSSCASRTPPTSHTMHKRGEADHARTVNRQSGRVRGPGANVH